MAQLGSEIYLLKFENLIPYSDNFHHSDDIIFSMLRSGRL